VDIDDVIVEQILQATKIDHRGELFARAIKTGADIQSANRKLLLRMRLYVVLLSTSALGGAHSDSVTLMLLDVPANKQN